jgi:replicative DNA helicase
MEAGMKANRRALPSNEHSERVILGELLLNNSAWEEAKTLTEDAFSLHSHQRVFACIRSRLSIARPIDLILLTDAMKRQGELDRIGGPAYLCHLTEDNIRNLAVGEHLALLKEKTALRRIIGACHEASERAWEEYPSGEIVAKLKEAL